MIVTRQFVVVAALTFGSALNTHSGEQPFDVSLTSPRFVDLSACYQRVVREAAAAYIGDFPPGAAITTKHIVRTVYIGTPLLRVPPELEQDFVPFPPHPLRLRVSLSEDSVCTP
jgi:hypothetical protein